MAQDLRLPVEDDAAQAVIPGWYGKLPSLGDFASRRLSHELIEAWDRWLADEIGQMREQSPDTWLQAYLDSPTWRFVLAAGVLGPDQPAPLAGVLMPSVDRVGRYFPLSIMAPLPGLPMGTAPANALFNWLHALDDIAADALQEDWPIEDLEQALARHPAPTWHTPAPPLDHALAQLADGSARVVSLPLPQARAAMVHDLAQALWNWGLNGGDLGVLGHHWPPGLVWWWSEPDADPAGRQVLLSRGLPCGADFTRLMGPPQQRVSEPGDLGDTALLPITMPPDAR